MAAPRLQLLYDGRTHTDTLHVSELSAVSIDDLNARVFAAFPDIEPGFSLHYLAAGAEVPVADSEALAIVAVDAASQEGLPWASPCIRFRVKKGGAGGAAASVEDEDEILARVMRESMLEAEKGGSGGAGDSEPPAAAAVAASKAAEDDGDSDDVPDALFGPVDGDDGDSDDVPSYSDEDDEEYIYDDDELAEMEAAEAAASEEEDAEGEKGEGEARDGAGKEELEDVTEEELAELQAKVEAAHAKIKQLEASLAVS
eukprot:PLAT2168.1.p1 GENE.PLAT2168.1~~PLAT2168.1.p1  ORF type:complete len:267 (+),score=77.73 PLAT2168.1:31-801(+)